VPAKPEKAVRLPAEGRSRAKQQRVVTPNQLPRDSAPNHDRSFTCGVSNSVLCVSMNSRIEGVAEPFGVMRAASPSSMRESGGSRDRGFDSALIVGPFVGNEGLGK